MATPAKLLRFTIKPEGKDFRLRIESDAGEALDILASHDQLDVIADSLDDILLTDEAGDTVSEKD